METHLKDAAQKVAADECQGRSVQGHDGQVGQAQEPSADEAMGLAEGPLGVDELSTGNGESADHVAVVEGDDDQDDGRHAHGNGRTRRACRGQEGVAGHDEGAPTDDAAKGQRPDV